MGQRNLLSSFSILMRASGLGNRRGTSEEDDEEVPSERVPAADDGQRLIRAFMLIQESAVRQAVIDVVTAIAKLRNEV
jgi:hypothetical protein